MAAKLLPPHVYQQLISNGIRGLSAEALAEIADFVFFLRKRAADPEVFQDELHVTLLNAELAHLSANEWSHLDLEVVGYEQQYPRE
jgi:hypothetical protein